MVLANVKDLGRDFECASRNGKACGRKMVSAGCARPVENEDEREVEA